jgi:hypothetical protein
MAWEPQSGKLWTAVNERDEIGSDLVPDYITSVKDGAFMAGPSAITASMWTCASPRKIQNWWPRPSHRTMRWVLTLRRWD